MAEENTPVKEITPEEFFLESPLYDKVTLKGDNAYPFRFTIKYPKKRLTIDSYCPYCLNQSVFINKEIEGSHSQIVSDGLHTTIFRCSRDNEHWIGFIFLFHQDWVQKIGQFPSIADLQKAEIEKYHKILGNDKYKEFTKAIGLASHGVGIGSFVYLRRIFESLIEEAHTKASTASEFKEEDYIKGRMAEKIVLLKEHLPGFLIENKSLYSILSKGVHELSEDECIKFFPVIKIGIEIILDQKLESKKIEEKALKAKEAIREIHGELSQTTEK